MKENKYLIISLINNLFKILELIIGEDENLYLNINLFSVGDTTFSFYARLWDTVMSKREENPFHALRNTLPMGRQLDSKLHVFIVCIEWCIGW